MRNFSDYDLYYDDNMEIVATVVRDLDEASDEMSWDTSASLANWREQAMEVTSRLDDTLRRCTLKMMDGIVYVFDGIKYIPVRDAVFDAALEKFLRGRRIRLEVLYNASEKIKRHCLRSIALNRPLHPTYNWHCFRNGVVNLMDGELRPFSPDYHVVYQHPYDFDVNACCPIWDSFLRDILDDRASRLLLQMFFGLCTYDRGYMRSKVENCLILYGAGSNGKSVIQQTLVGVLGEPNVSHMDLKSLTCGGDDQKRNLSEVDGKLINLGTELNKREIIGREDQFKKLVSGEPQYARRIGGNAYCVTNIPWMVFNMNNMLKMDDVSHGVQRRILYCVFDKIIPEERQNKHLATDLIDEYPGIMNWLVRGARKLQKSRFQFPQTYKGRRFSQMTEGINNPMRSWVNLRGIRFYKMSVDDNYVEFSSKVLYKDFCRYCELNGFEYDITQTTFGKEMTKVSEGGVRKRRMPDGMFYFIYGVSEEKMAEDPPIIGDKFTLLDGETLEEAMFEDL